MSGILRASAMIARAHFARLVLSRRALFCTLLVLLPAGAAFVTASFSRLIAPAAGSSQAEQ